MPGDHFMAGWVDAIVEQAELDLLIAEDIWTGRSARFEFTQGMSNHPFLVFGLERHDFEGNPSLFTNGADILQVVLPWAIAKKGEFLLEPNFEVIGGDFMRATLLNEAQGHR